MFITPPAVVLTQILSLLCRFLSCEDQYETPTSLLPEGFRANRTFARRLDDVPDESDNSLYSKTLQNDSISESQTLLRTQGGVQYDLLHPIVSTQSGSVEGYYMKVVSGRKIYAFEGIPYAEPPTGSFRFKPPVPKRKWNGVLETKDPGAACMQLYYGRLEGSEDCLRLNIYTPVLPVGKENPKLPIVLFIHGGAFITGRGSTYGPAYLLEEDVILVTFNYRLGILGSFSTGDEVAPGNWGLKDQAAAINWVYENIEHFGGDKNRITLSGQSAGAVSAHLQMLSPLAQDKLSNVICFSGGAFNFWGVNTIEQAQAVSLANARLAFCPEFFGSGTLLDCMQGVDAETLVANQILVVPVGFPVMSLEPNVTGAFLPASPDELYKQGKVAKIPLITSITSQESNFVIATWEARRLLPILRRVVNNEAPILLQYRGKVPPEEEDNIFPKIKLFYNETRSHFSREFFTKIGTDRYFTTAFHKAVQMHSQVAPTYAGVFSYASTLGSAAKLGLDYKKYGVAHTEDLIYFLNSTGFKPISRQDPSFAFTKLFVNVIKHFSETGEPSYTSEEDGKLYKFWEQNYRNPEDLKLLSIDEEVKMIPDIYKKISSFWESLGFSDTTSYIKLE